MAPVPSTLTQDKALFSRWWAHTTPPKTLEEEQGRYSASPAFAERIHEATDLVETLAAGITARASPSASTWGDVAVVGPLP